MTRSRRLTVVLSAGFAIAAALAPANATSYQQTQTCEPTGIYKCAADESPKPVSWPVRCVRYRIHRSGTSELDSDGDGRLDEATREHVRAAFETWNRPSCSDLQLVEGPLTSNDRAEFDRSKGWSDNMNLVVWRESTWPYNRGHSFALTSVTYDANTGRIADADIELNAAQSTFGYFESSKIGETEKVDLGNALTHEVGHLIGLDHVEDFDATMYAAAATGEIKKRTLEEDDIRGLCSIYPAGEPRATCDAPEDFRPDDVPRKRRSGCTTSAPAPPLGWAGLLAALLFVWPGWHRSCARCRSSTSTD